MTETKKKSRKQRHADTVASQLAFYTSNKGLGHNKKLVRSYVRKMRAEKRLVTDGVSQVVKSDA